MNLKNGSKKFKGTQKNWSKFLKPADIIAAPFFRMAVAAKSEKRTVGQATTNILKSISGGKILSLADMHGVGLRLKVL